MKKFTVFLIVCSTLLYPISHTNAQTVPGCGSLDNAYGPYDYTNPMHFTNRLPIVEQNHFNRNVESLKSGAMAGAGILADLDYTLRAFPNHHRALYAMMRFRSQNPARQGSRYRTAECYFKRALTFKSDDGIVWMLYGIYKHKGKQYKEALTNYKNAEKLLKNSAELYYNMGLLYFDMGDTKLAKKYAKLAYKIGYPLPALRDKLKLVDSQ